MNMLNEWKNVSIDRHNGRTCIQSCRKMHKKFGPENLVRPDPVKSRSSPARSKPGPVKHDMVKARFRALNGSYIFSQSSVWPGPVRARAFQKLGLRYDTDKSPI